MASEKAGESRRGSLMPMAVERIREMVKEGRLRPGDRVNEVELATSLQISRGPVREAVRLLISRGLLTDAPNLGARVISPDPGDVREFYLVRELLEGNAAYEAATNMTDPQRRNLLAVVDQHARKIASDPSIDYPQSQDDWDFHMLVLKGSHNKLITRICGFDLRDVFLLLRARYGRRQKRGPRALKEHQLIANAIADGNADLAQLLMRQHIQASHRTFLKMLYEGEEQPAVEQT